jgi:dihydropteroate synthase
LPEVAQEALKRGATVVNDVSCGQNEGLAEAARDADADLILMHSRGNMANMPGFSTYDEKAYGDVVTDVTSEWRAAEERMRAEGLSADRIWFDPGLGFHKNAKQSSELMRRLEEFSDLGQGTVLGASRKSFIGALDNSSPSERLGGSIAACVLALQKGACILRVHDVQPVSQALLAMKAWSPTAQSELGGAHA